MNPYMTIGFQTAEPLWAHDEDDQLTERVVLRRVLEVLNLVELGDADLRRFQKPGQFSVGEDQRVLIAMALVTLPTLMIADEPTTALDVMVQAQLLDLLQNLQRRLGLSIILVTHDLGVVAEICDEVLVMYAGRVVEYGSVEVIFNNPRHPYTQRLLQAFPDVANPRMTLTSIPGYPPPLAAMPPGCRFEPRCLCSAPVCTDKSPRLVRIEPGHFVACHRVRGTSYGTESTIE